MSIKCALCDLGSSVRLMPFSFYENLDLREMRPTTIYLQLADRSVKYPVGILEDVPIKVGDLYVPVDFVILEMQEKAFPPHSSLSDTFPLSPEIDIEDVLNRQDTPDFGWISTEDPNQRYVKVEFATPRLHSIPKVRAYASNEFTMSDYCKFA